MSVNSRYSSNRQFYNCYRVERKNMTTFVWLILKTKRAVSKRKSAILDQKGILYLCEYGRGVIVLNLSDYTESDFNLPGYYVNFQRGITLSKNNVCVCDFDTDEVILLDLQENIIWKFVDKNVLLSPTHLTSDANGNIYALGRASYNVVFLSADGKHGRQV